MASESEEIAKLNQRVYELERIVDYMASLLPGFGTSGAGLVRLRARRELAAAKAAEEGTLRERCDIAHKPAEH